MIVGQLQVPQVDALKGRQERHGRRGGAADLNDACGLCLCGLGRFLLRGPHLTQWRISLGQVVGAGVADTDFSLEENGEFVGQLRGGRAGNDCRRARGDGSDALIGNRDIEAEQLRRGGEPFDLSEDRAFLQFAGDGAGVQLVTDDHAFNAGPVLGHVTTFLSVVTPSHHTLFHCGAWHALLLARAVRDEIIFLPCRPIRRP